MAVSRFLMFHKCCLIFTTFLIGVLGLWLVCSGLWIRFDVEFRRYVDETDNFNILFAGAYVIICIGLVITAVATLGCFGAVKNNVCIIVTFFVALLICFSLYTTMVTAAFLAVIQKETLLQLLGDALKELLYKYYDDLPSKNLMSAIQKQFACCGADKGISDYATYTNHKKHPGACLMKLFGQPCNTALVNSIKNNALILSAISVTVAIVMLIGLIQSILLCRAVRHLNSSTPHNGGTPMMMHDDFKMADEHYQGQHQQQQKPVQHRINRNPSDR